jgi:hypothetical protein
MRFVEIFYEKFNNYNHFINISMKIWMIFNKNKFSNNYLTLNT